MGILKNTSSEVLFTLDLRNLIGRAMSCGIQLTDPRVSGEHASLIWDGVSWRLKDLGSTNGSFVDGRRLPAGGVAALDVDSRVGLGKNDDAWRLVDAGAPAARARSLSGEVVVGSSGLLLLPSDERPVLSISWTAAGRWQAESLEEPRGEPWPIADQEMVPAGAVAWRVFLPQPLMATTTLNSLQLELQISADEEVVAIVARQGQQRQPLKPGGFGDLLLTLARGRLADRALPELEQGWIHQETLAGQLQIDPSAVNIQIVHARQELERSGLQSGELVQRRAGTGQLRLGTSAVAVTRL